MANEEVGKVLKMALALEKKNFKDYLKSAEEAEIESVKKMFEFLAKEEEKHIEMIQEKMKIFGIEED